METAQKRHNPQRGFSLIELMIVIAVLVVVTGGIFSQINTAQQRMYTEQNRVDNFGEARDFVDQFFRDINQIGYPNGRMVSFAVTPNSSDSRLAVGLVKIDNNAIWFEGDIDGSGVVQSVQYKVNGSGACALCLQRSAIPKVNGTAPLLQTATVWGTEVNDVISNPIFTYFDNTGAQILPASLPADIAANPGVLAIVKTIHINLTIQNNAIIDPATKQAIQTNFEGEVSLNNCSLAANGYAMSCR